MRIETITIVGHADNRGGESRKTGKRVPLVQILITHFGDVTSIAFPPEQAPAIAEAIAKAGRAAKRNRKTEYEIEVRDEF